MRGGGLMAEAIHDADARSADDLMAALRDPGSMDFLDVAIGLSARSGVGIAAADCREQVTGDGRVAFLAARLPAAGA